MNDSVFLMLKLATVFCGVRGLILNSTEKPDCQPASKHIMGYSSSLSLPDHANAEGFLNRASCFGTPGNEPGPYTHNTVRLACGTWQEVAEFYKQNRRLSGVFTPPRQWSPVPPECFYSECPWEKFDYPTGCSEKGEFNACIFSGSWYFARNVLDVNVKLSRPPSGSWKDAAVFHQTGIKSWTFLTLNSTDNKMYDMMTEFGFAASESELRVSVANTSDYYKGDGVDPEHINGSFRIIHNRYFMPVRPANSTIAPNSRYCAQLSFPLGGYVDEKNNSTKLPDWPIICVRECPLGSAYPEADKPLATSSPQVSKASSMGCSITALTILAAVFNKACLV